MYIRLKPEATPLYVFILAVVFWCAKIQERVQFIECRRLPNVSKCVLVCVCSNSSLKSLGQLKPNSRGATMEKGGGGFIQMILIIAVLRFNFVSLHGVAVQGFKQGFKN